MAGRKGGADRERGPQPDSQPPSSGLSSSLCKQDVVATSQKEEDVFHRNDVRNAPTQEEEEEEVTENHYQHSTTTTAPPGAMDATHQKAATTTTDAPMSVEDASHGSTAADTTSRSNFFNQVMMRSVQKAEPRTSSSSSALLPVDAASQQSQGLDEKASTSYPLHSRMETNDPSTLDMDRTVLLPRPSSTMTPQTKPKKRPRSSLESSSTNPLEESSSPSMALPVPRFSTPMAKTETTTTTLFSPQGFQMLQYIHQVEDTLFQSQAAAAPTQQAADDDKDPATTTTTVAPRPEWYHFPLSPQSTLVQPSTQQWTVPFLDWSLKEEVTLELEGFDSSTPWVSSSFLGRTATIFQQSQQQSSSHNGVSVTIGRNNSHGQLQQYLTQWDTSLLYYQYPAESHGWSPISHNKKPMTSRTSSTGTNHASSSFLTKRSFGSSSHNNTTTTTTSTLGWKGGGPNKDTRSKLATTTGGGTVDATVLPSRHAAETLLLWKDATGAQLPHEVREWQDAFWSLYGNWRVAVQQCIHPPTNTASSSSSPQQSLGVEEAVTQTCFYACGAGHSVLFRMGRSPKKETEKKTTTVSDSAAAATNDPPACESDKENGNDDDDSVDSYDFLGAQRPQHCEWDYVPEVIFSSSCTEMRQKLRQLGASLSFIDGGDDTESEGQGMEFSNEQDFWKRMEQPLVHKDAKVVKTAETSPSIQAELVALRRAQSMGQTVGPDITVKTKTTTTRPKAKR